ncbi:hypothetical protein [Mesorhizobium sp. WSM3224]|uniref:hypothetical protein n=1 Tax=Mesorhizobium sp. WSM3224 TaxID=1040986 RepID=UPI0012EB15B4|nr:hypothetical protein [Mesorhizobium sp. WSM3224]
MTAIKAGMNLFGNYLVRTNRGNLAMTSDMIEIWAGMLPILPPRAFISLLGGTAMFQRAVASVVTPGRTRSRSGTRDSEPVRRWTICGWAG